MTNGTIWELLMVAILVMSGYWKWGTQVMVTCLPSDGNVSECQVYKCDSYMQVAVTGWHCCGTNIFVKYFLIHSPCTNVVSLSFYADVECDSCYTVGNRIEHCALVSKHPHFWPCNGRSLMKHMKMVTPRALPRELLQLQPTPGMIHFQQLQPSLLH